MKEIVLPTTQTFSMPLDATTLKSGMVGEGHNQGRALGSLTVNERVWSEVATAKKNGGAILYATTAIEQKLESILLNYFLGPSISFNDQRRMFDREILKSTLLSFSAKNELVIKVINEGELLSKKNKPVIPKYLKEIMEWRNAFAHGKLIYDSKRGGRRKCRSFGTGIDDAEACALIERMMSLQASVGTRPPAAESR